MTTPQTILGTEIAQTRMEHRLKTSVHCAEGRSCCHSEGLQRSGYRQRGQQPSVFRLRAKFASEDRAARDGGGRTKPEQSKEGKGRGTPKGRDRSLAVENGLHSSPRER